MSNSMKVSTQGLDFIKAHEGFRSRPEALQHGGWVVGYSHTRTARADTVVSREDADALLIYDLRMIEEGLNEKISTPLSQPQFDALASLAFSIGWRNFTRSGLPAMINDGRLFEAASAFDIWRLVRAGDEVEPSERLIRRRAVEKAMFLTSSDSAALSSAIAQPVADPDAVARAQARQSYAAPTPRADLQDRIADALAPTVQTPPPHTLVDETGSLALAETIRDRRDFNDDVIEDEPEIREDGFARLPGFLITLIGAILACGSFYELMKGTGGWIGELAWFGLTVLGVLSFVIGSIAMHRARRGDSAPDYDVAHA